MEKEERSSSGAGRPLIMPVPPPAFSDKAAEGEDNFGPGRPSARWIVGLEAVEMPTKLLDALLFACGLKDRFDG